MKKNKKFIKGIILTFSFLSILLSSCNKDKIEQSEETGIVNYEVIINNKTYNTEIEYNQDGNGLKFLNTSDIEVQEFIKSFEKSFVVHTIDDKLYLYKDQEEFNSKVSFGFDIKEINNNLDKSENQGLIDQNSNKLKSSAGMIVSLAEHLYQAPTWNLGITGSFYNSHILQGGTWYGTAPNMTVFPAQQNLNDKISSINILTNGATNQLHRTAFCYLDANYGGNVLVITRTSNSSRSFVNLHTIPYSWFSSWADQISSMITFQSNLIIGGVVI